MIRAERQRDHKHESQTQRNRSAGPEDEPVSLWSSLQRDQLITEGDDLGPHPLGVVLNIGVHSLVKLLRRHEPGQQLKNRLNAVGSCAEVLLSKPSPRPLSSLPDAVHKNCLLYQ